MTEAKRTKGRKRSEQAYESNLRVVGLVDLASMAGTDQFEERPDGAVEDLMDFLLDPSYRIHASLEPLRAAAKDADDSIDILGELLSGRGLLGLVVHFSTPVMTRMSAKAMLYSWGYTTGTWIYADTYEDAWKLGVQWAEKCRAEAKEPTKSAALSA